MRSSMPCCAFRRSSCCWRSLPSSSPSLSPSPSSIAATAWMEVARIVEAQIRSLRERDFAVAARGARRAPTRCIMFRELLPNALAPIVVAATLNVAHAILLEAYISFLGYGIQPPTAELGQHAEQRAGLSGHAPWLAIFPGARDHARGHRLQLHRRRPARRARPAVDHDDRDLRRRRCSAVSRPRACDFRAARRSSACVDGVSFALRRGETLALVGESGSGKSVTSLAHDAAARRAGRAAISGALPARCDGDARSARRCPSARCARSAAATIAMIFQEPMTSLNPVLHGRRPDRRSVRIHRG